jgi:hypothetical protein
VLLAEREYQTQNIGFNSPSSRAFCSLKTRPVTLEICAETHAGLHVKVVIKII